MGSADKTDIGTTLEVLRSDVGDLAEELTSLLTEKSNGGSSDLKQRVQQIRDDMDVLFSEASRKLIEQARVEGLIDSIGSTVRERPFAMMAVAAGLGAVIASQAWPGRSSARTKAR